MRYYTIELDEIIMNYLKKHAEPFSDTPNSVLHRLLFGTSTILVPSQDIHSSLSGHIPKALIQIIEVVSEVIKGGRSRPEATKIVATRNDTKPQTIIDKYTRQLGKKAHEIDRLLDEPGLGGFKMILMNKFPNHRNEIGEFFENLQNGKQKTDRVTELNNQPQATQDVSFARRSPSTTNRKKRDTALEASLKTALGNQLRKKFGSFHTQGQSQLVFTNDRVLCKYSSFHSDQSRWFWGVAKTYWLNWESADHLALIIENEDENRYSYLLLDSAEAKTLFNRCSESVGEKKINMRIYMADDILRFQEWQDFNVEARIQSLYLD